MSPLQYLERIGITARAEGERIICRPRSALNDAVRAWIRANRAELLAALRRVAEQPKSERMAKIMEGLDQVSEFKRRAQSQGPDFEPDPRLHPSQRPSHVSRPRVLTRRPR